MSVANGHTTLKAPVLTEVKQRRARLVLGWVTAWEHRLLLSTFSFLRPRFFFSFFSFLSLLTFYLSVCVLTFRFLNPSSPSSSSRSSSLSFFLIMLIFQLSSFCKCTLFFFLMLVTFFIFFVASFKLLIFVPLFSPLPFQCPFFCFIDPAFYTFIFTRSGI